jgi:hypothetical protein
MESFNEFDHVPRYMYRMGTNWSRIDIKKEAQQKEVHLAWMTCREFYVSILMSRT